MKKFIEDFKEGQKLFGELIFGIVNFVALTIVYFLGIGLTFLASKVSHKKFLEETPNISDKTYWEELNLDKKPLGDYYRQF